MATAGWWDLRKCRAGLRLSEEMVMMRENPQGYSDAEWQARVELAAAYRLTA